MEECAVEPLAERGLHGLQMAREKMICMGDQNELLWFRSGVDNCAELANGRVLVMVTAKEELGEGA